MRRIVFDHARRKRALKRGGNRRRVDMFSVSLADPDRTLAVDEILTLHAALDQMQLEYPEHVEIVLLNYFAGMKARHIAEMLNISLRTVERRLKFARAWLYTRIASK